MDKVIDNLSFFLAHLCVAFPEYRFHLQIQGGGWARAFVTYNGISLGRINFQPAGQGKHEIYGVKHYKPYDYEYSKEDAFFYLIHAWIETGKRIDIDRLIEVAKANKLKKIEEIEKWREEHPVNRKRMRISNNWNGELSRLVREEAKRVII